MTLSAPHKLQSGIVLALLISLMAVSCNRKSALPAKSSKEYDEAVRTFYVGLAALQVGDDNQADARLAQLTLSVPGEPAGWANWGVLALRQRKYDAAAERFEKARTIVPDNDQINYLIGLLESGRGRQAESIAALREAVKLNPKNLVATYQLAQELERQASQNSEAEFQQLIEQILKAQPNNLAALLELARISAKRGDANTLRDAMTRISAQSASWPVEVQQQLSAAQAAASGSDPAQTATRIVFLRNVLVRVPQYRQDLSTIQPPPGEEATPFLHFLRLETPTFTPAAMDSALTFNPETVPDFNNEGWTWIGAIPLGVTGGSTLTVANGREVRLRGGASFPFPGGAAGTSPSPEGILPIDFTYDFKTDLVLAGAGGVRLMQQENAQKFTDVTAQAKLPATVTSASYLGAWTGDIEADGDLDVVLGAPTGLPTVLRNNGDGTFLEIHPFNDISGLQGFAWADLDADGDTDAALIDGAGKLHFFSNQRQGQFAERALPPNPSAVQAVTVADINSDGILDLIAVQTDGGIIRLSDSNEGQKWETAEIANFHAMLKPPGQKLRLRVADLDNNGGLDLLLGSVSDPSRIAGASVWLSDEKGELKPLGQPVEVDEVFDAADLNGDGRLDLVGLNQSGQATQAINHGSKNYHWQVVRPHATAAVGDQRINPFGVGGRWKSAPA